MNIEEIFKSIIALIFAIIFLGALSDLTGSLNLSGIYSFMIGFAFLAIIISVLLKILDEFGGLK